MCRIEVKSLINPDFIFFLPLFHFPESTYFLSLFTSDLVPEIDLINLSPRFSDIHKCFFLSNISISLQNPQIFI